MTMSARAPIPELEISPKPARSLHNATESALLTKLPEELRQRIYEYVLQDRRSQVVYVQTQMPGAHPEFRCTFIPQPVERYLSARQTNPSLFIYRLYPSGPYDVLHTYDVSSIMKQLRQRVWTLPLVCRKVYAETWHLLPPPCTFAFPSDLDLRLFLRVLDEDSRRRIGGLCVSWQTLSSLIQKMPGLKTVYLYGEVFSPERETEAREFYNQFCKVVMVGKQSNSQMHSRNSSGTL